MKDTVAVVPSSFASVISIPPVISPGSAYLRLNAEYALLSESGTFNTVISPELTGTSRVTVSSRPDDRDGR